MIDLSRSSARTAIDVAEASEIARLARQDDPNVISRDDVQSLLGQSVLVLDGLRERPLYFDGRFLTGGDLTRDQNYIRQRQADLARAGGTGVVSGLRVGLSGEAAGAQLTIGAGHGVTPSGDLVLVAAARSLPPLDIPSVERLDATLGLRREPRLPLGRRTGLFILALRPVEFTANPIAAYPTSITGRREVEDGDIIEASAITLIPYPETGGGATLDEARRTVARDIFLGQTRGIPQDVLPLAMIAFDRGAVRWIDEALVRRETGADTPLQVALGASPRARAEAFVVQHRRHLRDVVRDRREGGLPDAFAAAQYFAALPAAGQLPAATVLTDPLGFTQMWFPPAVNVDIGFVPSDEIAALVDESLALPAIDLMGEPEDLDATGVLILAPVTRQRLQRFEQALTTLTTPARGDPAQGIRRAPLTMLAAIQAKRIRFSETAVRDTAAEARTAAADAETKAWQAAWAEAVAALPTRIGEPPLLWYVRRRAIASQAQVSGVAVAVAGDDERLGLDVRANLDKLGETARLDALNTRATPFAAARMLAFLGAPRIAASSLLTRSALHDLELALPGVPAPAEGDDTPRTRVTPVAARRALTARAAGVGEIAIARPGLTRLAELRTSLAAASRPRGTTAPLTEADIIDVASDYGSSHLGDGLSRLFGTKEQALEEDAEKWLASSGLTLALDDAAFETDPSTLAAFASTAGDAIKAKDEDALARVAGAGGEG